MHTLLDGLDLTALETIYSISLDAIIVIYPKVLRYFSGHTLQYEPRVSCKEHIQNCFENRVARSMSDYLMRIGFSLYLYISNIYLYLSHYQSIRVLQNLEECSLLSFPLPRRFPF